MTGSSSSDGTSSMGNASNAPLDENLETAPGREWLIFGNAEKAGGATYVLWSI